MTPTCWWPCCDSGESDTKIVAAHTYGTTTKGVGNLSAFEPSDGSLLWTTDLFVGVPDPPPPFVNTPQDFANLAGGCKIHPDGSVYVAWQPAGDQPITVVSPKPGGTLTKVNKDGVIQWHRQLPATSCWIFTRIVCAISKKNTDHIYLGGFAFSQGRSNGDDSDGLCIKRYDPDGNDTTPATGDQFRQRYVRNHPRQTYLPCVQGIDTDVAGNVWVRGRRFANSMGGLSELWWTKFDEDGNRLSDYRDMNWSRFARETFTFNYAWAVSSLPAGGKLAFGTGRPGIDLAATTPLFFKFASNTPDPAAGQNGWAEYQNALDEDFDPPAHPVTGDLLSITGDWHDQTGPNVVTCAQYAGGKLVFGSNTAVYVSADDADQNDGSPDYPYHLFGMNAAGGSETWEKRIWSGRLGSAAGGLGGGVQSLGYDATDNDLVAGIFWQNVQFPLDSAIQLINPNSGATKRSMFDTTQWLGPIPAPTNPNLEQVHVTAIDIG